MKKFANLRTLGILAAMAGIFCVLFFAIPTLHVFAEGEATAGAAAGAGAGGTTLTPPESKDWLGIQGLISIITSAPEKIGYWFLGLVSYVLWLAGVCFQIALRLTLGIKYLAENAGLRAAWIALRDFSNILFIFVMLYISIMAILDLEDYKKPLKNLIIAAIFINFSFFIAGLIIDASNVFAIGIYNTVSPKAQITSDPQSIFDPMKDSSGGSIAEQFMEKMKLNKLFDSRGVSTKSDGKKFIKDNVGVGGINLLVSIVMGIIVILVASFVFFTGAILLIVRTATLLFLLAVSPIAFAGHIVPKLKKQSNDWWAAIVDQSFFAPAFLLCIYVSLSILSGLNTQTIARRADAAGLIFGNILVIFFLLASMKVAKEFGAKGADAAQEYGAMIPKFVGRQLTAATVGGAAALGRNTLGRGASALGATGFGGNYISGKLVDVGRKSSFDLRNVSAVNPKDLLGKGTKGGYDQVIDDSVEAKKKAADARGKINAAKAQELDDKRDKALKGDEGKELTAELQDARDNYRKENDEEYKKKKAEIDEERNRRQANLKPQIDENRERLNQAGVDVQAFLNTDAGKKITAAQEATAAAAKNKQDLEAKEREIAASEVKAKQHEDRADNTSLSQGERDAAKTAATAERALQNQKQAEKTALETEKTKLEAEKKTKVAAAENHQQELKNLESRKSLLEKEKQSLEKTKESIDKDAKKKDEEAETAGKDKAAQKIQDEFDKRHPGAKIEAAKRMREYAEREEKFGKAESILRRGENLGFAGRAANIVSMPVNTLTWVGTGFGKIGSSERRAGAEVIRKSAKKKVEGKTPAEILLENVKKEQKEEDKKKAKDKPADKDEGGAKPKEGDEEES